MIGDLWICKACGKYQKITENGVRCSGKGHQVYRSLEALNGYSMNNKDKQLKLF